MFKIQLYDRVKRKWRTVYTVRTPKLAARFLRYCSRSYLWHRYRVVDLHSREWTVERLLSIKSGRTRKKRTPGPTVSGSRRTSPKGRTS